MTARRSGTGGRATGRRTARGGGTQRRGAAGVLTERLVALANSGELALFDDARTWRSGVYALVDAVFRARASYAAVVLPMLEERLPARPGMHDRATLRFSDLLADVATCGRDPASRAEAYACEVLNRQRIGGCLKVDVCCEAATLLADRGLETGRRLRGLSQPAWDELARDLRGVTGFGDLLVRHLAAALDRETPGSPTPRTVRFAAGLAPRAEIDASVVTAALARTARRLRLPAVRLDVTLHRRAFDGVR
jgi:hypothetical protein